MSMRIRVAGVLLAAALATNCDGGPVAPGGPFLGTWAGAIVDSAAGAGTARLVLTQSGAGVSGTFTTTFPTSSFDRAGSVSGTATGATASTFLTPSAPTVCGSGASLSGTMGATVSIAGTKLTGGYSVLLCTGAGSGTLDLTRQ